MTPGIAPDFADRLAGCLIGGAVGDALGLPMEGLRRRRAARLFPPPLRHRFLFGRGMVSDDTEHACITAWALLRSNGDEERFLRALAGGLRLWLARLPAGAGLATLKATSKLCVGVSPHRSGVRSAGNGPAMRAPIIGAYFRNDLVRMRRFVELSSKITHTDARAIDGAYLVAVAAANRPSFFSEARGVQTDCWQLDLIEEMLGRRGSPLEFADALGLLQGVSGFVVHTVPVAIYCALWAGDDFRAGIEAAAALGGDTDTLCAIVGGIIGARVGRREVPAEWVDGLWEWPRSVSWMERLAKALAEGGPAPRANGAADLLRSPIFLATVLFHGFRRLFPPY